MKHIFTLIALAGLTSGFLSAAEPGTTLAPWLKVDAAPEVIAMGDAGVARPGVASLAYNPASIALIDQVTVAFNHTESAYGIHTEGLDLVHPSIGFGTLAIQTRGIWDDSIEARDNQGNQTGTLNYYSAAYGLAWAGALPMWNKTWLGVQLKGIQDQYSTEVSDATAAADIGILTEVSGGPLPPDTMLLGVSILNAGIPVKYDAGTFAPPLQVRLGIQWKPSESRVTTVADLAYYDDMQTLVGKVGGEIRVWDALKVRAGYNFDPSNLDTLSGLSAGMGVKLSPWTIDYAFTPQGSIGGNHRLALSATFGSGFLQELLAPKPAAAAPVAVTTSAETTTAAPYHKPSNHRGNNTKASKKPKTKPTPSGE